MYTKDHNTLNKTHTHTHSTVIILLFDILQNTTGI